MVLEALHEIKLAIKHYRIAIKGEARQVGLFGRK